MPFFPDHMFDCGSKTGRESPQKRRDALKTAILTNKSKIFIKAKLMVSKSCLLGLLNFHYLCIMMLQYAFIQINEQKTWDIFFASVCLHNNGVNSINLMK